MDRATFPEAARRSEIAAEADFSRIRYAQCWEDTEVVLAALDLRPGGVCFSIASGGDNSLALLAHGPARVIAVDLSPAQLALTELKAAAFRALTHAETLELAGLADSPRRIELYQRLRTDLAEGTRTFWDGHLDTIERGLSGAGKFERYLALFRRFVLPLAQAHRDIEALLVPKSAAERRRFYEERWDHWRWRGLLRVFASRFVMGRLGRDPSFFRYVEGGVAEQILRRAEHALTELDPASNPYLRWIVRGRFDGTLPYVWREENFAAIRRHVGRLELRLASVEAFLGAAEPASIDAFNLSDVFEYLSEQASDGVFDSIVRCARPRARIAYWNMMVPRRRPERLASRLHTLEDLSRTLHERAQTFFYGAFQVEEALAPTC